MRSTPIRAAVLGILVALSPLAAVQAQSSAITTAMIVLAVVALAGAVFAWVVIGRRRTPDHVQMTHAAEV